MEPVEADSELDADGRGWTVEMTRRESETVSGGERLCAWRPEAPSARRSACAPELRAMYISLYPSISTQHPSNPLKGFLTSQSV